MHVLGTHAPRPIGPAMYTGMKHTSDDEKITGSLPWKVSRRREALERASELVVRYAHHRRSGSPTTSWSVCRFPSDDALVCCWDNRLRRGTSACTSCQSIPHARVMRVLCISHAREGDRLFLTLRPGIAYLTNSVAGRPLPSMASLANPAFLVSFDLYATIGSWDRTDTGMPHICQDQLSSWPMSDVSRTMT